MEGKADRVAREAEAEHLPPAIRHVSRPQHPAGDDREGAPDLASTGADLAARQRLALVSPADAQSYPLPLTQQVLSDAPGLSLVHANRTLMQLRREGLLDRRQKKLVITEPEALAARVHFVVPSLRSEDRSAGKPGPASSPMSAAS